MVERITITIRKDVLKRIDRMIDGREIRNRSHAIEGLLSKSLAGGLKSALIMAGDGNNAFTPINGRPILEHQIDMLRSNGITNIVIACTTDKIRNYFGSGRAYGVELTYAIEEKPLGTAGAIGEMKEYADGSFVMLNADTLMDPDIHGIYEFHKRHRKLATLMLTTTDDPSHFGVVKMRGNQVVGFEEKPRTSAETSRLVNAGLCIFEKRVCDLVPKRKMMIEEILTKLFKQDQLSGFIHDGVAFDVGTKQGYDRAVKEWKG